MSDYVCIHGAKHMLCIECDQDEFIAKVDLAAERLAHSDTRRELERVKGAALELRAALTLVRIYGGGDKADEVAADALRATRWLEPESGGTTKEGE